MGRVHVRFFLIAQASFKAWLTRTIPRISGHFQPLVRTTAGRTGNSFNFHDSDDAIISLTHLAHTTMDGDDGNKRSLDGPLDRSMEAQQKKRAKEMSEEVAEADLESSLPGECLLNICHHLTQAELYHRWAPVSKRCYHHSRSVLLHANSYGTVNVRRDQSVTTALTKFCCPSLQRAFAEADGPRKELQLNLILEGRQQSADWKPGSIDGAIREQLKTVRLFNVQSLRITASDFREDMTHIQSLTPRLAELTPNVQSLSLPEFTNFVNNPAFIAIGIRCPKISTVLHMGGHALYSVHGRECANFSNLTTLRLPLTQIFAYETDAPQPLQEYGSTDPDHASTYLFHRCPFKLVTVDLRRTTLYGSKEFKGPVPQSWLMKFVRSTPTLRSFAGDLTKENIEVLQRERPDVNFLWRQEMPEIGEI